MTLVIEIPDEKVAGFKAQAEALGLTVEEWLRQLAERQVPSSSFAHLQQSDPGEWGRRFREWAEGHDPNTPVLSDEAMSRESIY